MTYYTITYKGEQEERPISRADIIEKMTGNYKDPEITLDLLDQGCIPLIDLPFSIIKRAAPLKKILVGFKCVNHPYGCECTIDVPERTKREFRQAHDFDYDEYCYYDLILANNESEALDIAYEQQGATEEETAREIWPDCEVIGDIDKIDTLEKEDRKTISSLNDIIDHLNEVRERLKKNRSINVLFDTSDIDDIIDEIEEKIAVVYKASREVV